MGTLYVVGVPAGDPDHLTLRARRTLEEVRHVVAEDVEGARALLQSLDIATQPGAVPDDDTGPRLLDEGDVALMVGGWPGEAGRRLVQAAAGQGHAVVAVPGPALPITALVLSGLPADAFLYLGEAPPEAAARRRWLAPAVDEQRTLVALAGPPLFEIVADLHEALGDRPLAVVPASSLDSRATWRGTLAAAMEGGESLPRDGACALVLGGAAAGPERWDEERVAAEIQAGLAQGRRAKEISREVADLSGWSRRQVYDLVIDRVRAGGKATRTHTRDE